MLLYRTIAGPVLSVDDQLYQLDYEWETLVNDSSLAQLLQQLASSGHPDPTLANAIAPALPPLGDRQEIWASGVTYFRSRTARMEESESAGGGDFYDRVYAAERPEIFFKATPHRTVGPGDAMRLRSDSKWMVPEPELVLVVTREGNIVGYTVGNDLSCRDLEGENPLYLPQAKTFDRCAAVGPGVFVPGEPISPESKVHVLIRRAGGIAFEGETTLNQMKRRHEELVEFLFRENAHPYGVLLMTGTGIVPPDDFTLEPDDVVDITIDGIGTLSNPMQ
ncbi:Fumarylacetoacetate (FAA) hydrolase family protein [Posidoniimonas corsicana]|uniref:Fumarylacetoacetate (FAA) hydrolase family protein n=1 Tax=Posidoniimonas corsicana TaxID=1938618 RepID=A0A5C5VBP0_9BACT|nr:fumarylacetoacetate hydrolase family protein [Posidoniimonas corsicana]TWT35239.1 Fumarylacetoacetate (FAA) hydrolase family protein [Posidoniimonas corsicana]